MLYFFLKYTFKLLFHPKDTMLGETLKKINIKRLWRFSIMKIAFSMHYSWVCTKKETQRDMCFILHCKSQQKNVLFSTRLYEQDWPLYRQYWQKSGLGGLLKAGNSAYRARKEAVDRSINVHKVISRSILNSQGLRISTTGICTTSSFQNLSVELSIIHHHFN